MVRKDQTRLRLAGQEIRLGERRRLNLEVGKLFDFTDVGIPIEVIRGKRSGPTLFITAVIHGDEINGLEIVRRLLRKKVINSIRGTLIAVPIVNVFGFNTMSRYLPDRRDLNRVFPGSKSGSLAARIAKTIMDEVVKKSTHGIDLHTGAIHRENLPHIRACIDDPETRELAEAFGVPLILHSDTRDGSLREATRKRNIPALLFEGGEALRFNEKVIRTGVRGCLSVMRKIGMLPVESKALKKPKSFIAYDSHWLRAPHGGCVRHLTDLGQYVEEGQALAVISDPFDREKIEVTADDSGIVIGMSRLPLVNKGDAIFHLATAKPHQKGFKTLVDMDPWI